MEGDDQGRTGVYGYGQSGVDVGGEVVSYVYYVQCNRGLVIVIVMLSHLWSGGSFYRWLH